MDTTLCYVLYIYVYDHPRLIYKVTDVHTYPSCPFPQVDGGLFSKPPAGETSNKSTVGDSNKVNLREKQPIRRFHSATDTSEGNKTAPASGLGIIDKVRVGVRLLIN